MSSSSSNLGGKSLSAPTSFTLPSQHTSVPSASCESSSRRPGLSNTPLPSSAPRKGQTSRRQHRNQRKPSNQRPDQQDDHMDEIGAVRNPTSRRGQTSITHLLEYSAPIRHHTDHSHYHRSRRRPTWGPGSGYHAIDKARFVHANYRFVVSPTGTYSSQAVDADNPLEWSDVLQIIASAESQTTSCPICLSDPVAPRMAKCGHIFCLPCLLRFMNSTADNESSTRKEARWAKCPICEDFFKLAETKPVRFYAGQENPLPRPGEDVVLRLMLRDSWSTLALPKEGGADVVNLGEDVPWHFAANVLDYAHIMKGTNDYLAEQFDREVNDLRRQAREDEHQFGVEDGDWTQRAIRAINTARDMLRNQKTDDTAALREASTARAKQPAGQQFYFYMAPPHLYLSPLDIRILKTKFGGFSSFPSTLLPRVEHISTGITVDDALKDRYKYLRHLPRGCEISFLECDWTDIVPAEILETFEHDLERRRKAHQDKAAQEERERVQAERMEAAAIGRSTRRHYDQAHEERLESATILNLDDFQPLSSVAGTTPPNPRPGFEHLAEVSTSPSAPRTVWGTPAIPMSPDLGPAREEEVNDGWLRDDEVFGAAEIAMQMEAFGLDGAKPGPANGTSSTGGKKKKKQKITLMSTGGRRFG
ncbi:hypothetical protein DL767_007767 [Monosporascus sp. MG133]|nr:hypothetical protein DL767_007767 [Monosporascus sp. MG133]